MVPLAVKVLPGDVEGARLLVADPGPGLVRAGVGLAHDPGGPRGRRGDEADDHLERPWGPAAPVAGDLGEEAVLDLDPDSSEDSLSPQLGDTMALACVRLVATPADGRLCVSYGNKRFDQPAAAVLPATAFLPAQT